jgi:NADPH-dependent curcumin reductase CurA
MIGKEIHLKKRPAGFVTEDNFELVEAEIPEIKKEGDFGSQYLDVSRSFYENIYGQGK